MTVCVYVRICGPGSQPSREWALPCAFLFGAFDALLGLYQKLLSTPGALVFFSESIATDSSQLQGCRAPGLPQIYWPGWRLDES